MKALYFISGYSPENDEQIERFPVAQEVNIAVSKRVADAGDCIEIDAELKKLLLEKFQIRLGGPMAYYLERVGDYTLQAR